MTRRTNARIAGVTYLFYIAVAFPDMLIFGRATRGNGITAQLATMAQHAGDLRLSAVLSLLSGLCAIVLGVTLHAITRDEDPDLALLAMMCRVGEGLTAFVAIPVTLGLAWIATSAVGDGANAGAIQTLASFLLQRDPLIPAWLFSVGSTIFCWLLLRGRMIPVWLAWTGMLGS